MQIGRFLPCLLVGLIAAGGCGGGSNGPSGPSTTVTQVQVGVSGNGSTQLAPGETRQLFAMAVGGSGTSNDVTNTATWQSSNPALATVSSTGLLTASAEGSVDVSATYRKREAGSVISSPRTAAAGVRR